MHKHFHTSTLILFSFLISSCGTTSATRLMQASPTSAAPPKATETLKPLQPMTRLTIQLDQDTASQHITLDSGGDVDSLAVTDGRKTGNGQMLPSSDGNQTPDFYMQFNVADTAILEGKPTSSVRIDIQYLDEGVDTFTLQYDAAGGGPFGDGRFLESRPVVKTDSGEFLTATFIFKDIYFGNRDNGADFRIDDKNDGAETIRRVTITILPQPKVINVDDCGANPKDDQPDSTAIQECINNAKTGDTILFTSGENSPGYIGYLIDKTVFLNERNPRSYLTFSSTDPSNKALLKATADLKGYVLKLFARSKVGDPASIDGMILTSLHLDGNRSERKCMGTDDVANGLDDNWGSWLPECTEVWDSWCMPGSLDLAGGVDWGDISQNYSSHPDRWSTGHLIENLVITNTECGTAFGMGGANNVILNNTIETAGDHVHASGCADTDETFEYGDWSDGITFDGPGHLVMGNTVINPSDIGIVFFGGRSTVIRDNTIKVTAGNYGAFGGIAIHPWGFGDISFSQVTGNIVISEGDETCGNLHTGINIGTHMWGGACLNNQVTNTIGNASCSLDPSPPGGSLCPRSGSCQLWASVAQADATFLFTDNKVSGAHINYLIEGLDLVGSLIESGNISTTPRKSDWEAAHQGCNGVYWGPLDKVAHHPSLPGWSDKRIHCER